MLTPTKWLGCRQEQEAALINDESSLVTALEGSLETCTKMLTSEDKGLSLASSAKMLLYRARCYIRQRELSYGLTDLASLCPCPFRYSICKLGLAPACSPMSTARLSTLVHLCNIRLCVLRDNGSTSCIPSSRPKMPSTSDMLRLASCDKILPCCTSSA